MLTSHPRSLLWLVSKMRSHRPLAVAAVTLLLLGRSSLTHKPHVPSAAAPVLKEGRSPRHHLIPTRSPDAQREFDRGLLLVYAFDYDEAIKSFERAAQLDPEASMPEWGLALALGPSLNDRGMKGRMPRAFAAALRAVESARDETDRERDYTRALATRYTPAPEFDLRQLNVAYADAMRSLAAKYPRDADLATLLAESLILAQDGPWWTRDGKPAESIEEALRVIESVLGRDPYDIGASHYHIHLLDASPTPERALSTARRLETIVPEFGHLLHMPSHIYMRVGDYRAAVASNLRAVAADRAHRGAHGVYQRLQGHSRDFLAAAASMTGQFQVARKANENLFVLLRFQRWDDVLALPERKGPVSTLEWRVARVLALTGRGRLKEAEIEQIAYQVAEGALPKDATWWADPIERFLPLARSEMAARLAWARGDKAGAIAHWRTAVEAQDQLTLVEAIMPWYHPARESLGAALYLSGQVAEADRVFREELKVTRGNGRSLFGLWQSLQAQGRMSEAQAVQQQFETAWQDADVQVSMEAL